MAVAPTMPTASRITPLLAAVNPRMNRPIRTAASGSGEQADQRCTGRNGVLTLG